MKSDIEIAQETTLAPIGEIAAKLGLAASELTAYGPYKAKVEPQAWEPSHAGKLILVTAVNPTPAGEGKTTLSIGLADALNKIGRRATLALREPSLGPVMGMKGGATGGGYTQVAPMEDINLHFTGDLHAMTTANNLIASVIDNEIYQQSATDIDPARVIWHRVLDMNDRTLRTITVGEGSRFNGVERQDHFDITVASEIMAVVCLAVSLHDLKARLSRILVAYTTTGAPVTLADLGIVGAVAVLLKDALKPNLVQTLDRTPAFVHGGPFANIAHGCNSVLATRAALMTSEFAVTEAGFGADLGAEKFLDIKTRQLGKTPDCIVIVATVRALKYNGGVARDDLAVEDLTALAAGFANLSRHIDNMQRYGVPVVVAVNRFAADTEAELSRLLELLAARSVPVAISTAFADGGTGATELAYQVAQLADDATPEGFRPLYTLDLPVEDKIKAVVTGIYHGADVKYSETAQSQLTEIKANGWDRLPVCLAKTQYSFSDDAKKLGAPEGFTVTVRELIPKLGAGFIVALLGKVITMPGLPKHPAAKDINISDDGVVSGIF